MSAVINGMLDHITAGGDQFDNKPMSGKELLDEKAQEDRAVAQLADALYEGDTFNHSFNATRTVSFTDVVDDELCCNSTFSNALRRLMIGKADEKSLQALRDAVNTATTKFSQSLYDDGVDA